MTQKKTMCSTIVSHYSFFSVGLQSNAIIVSSSQTHNVIRTYLVSFLPLSVYPVYLV